MLYMDFNSSPFLKKQPFLIVPCVISPSRNFCLYLTCLCASSFFMQRELYRTCILLLENSQCFHLLQAYDNLSLSDHLLRAVLNLLRREVSEHGRHLQQYFNLFVMYANLGKNLNFHNSALMY